MNCALHTSAYIWKLNLTLVFSSHYPKLYTQIIHFQDDLTSFSRPTTKPALSAADTNWSRRGLLSPAKTAKASRGLTCPASLSMYCRREIAHLNTLPCRRLPLQKIMWNWAIKLRRQSVTHPSSGVREGGGRGGGVPVQIYRRGQRSYNVIMPLYNGYATHI